MTAHRLAPTSIFLLIAMLALNAMSYARTYRVGEQFITKWLRLDPFCRAGFEIDFLADTDDEAQLAPQPRDSLFFAKDQLASESLKVVEVLEANALKDSRNGIKLINNWKYHPGDDPAWALREFDDTGWEATSTLLRRNELPVSGWPGIGWFRLHLLVDSTLANVPLGLRISQLGASAIYLNGKHLLEFGRVGATKNEVEGFYDPGPKIISFGAGEQLLAVRYANFVIDERFSAAQQSAGFLLRLGDADRFFKTKADDIRLARGYQMFFVGVAATFALLHLLFLLFYPRSHENLYYAVFTVGLALLIFAIFEYSFSMPFDRYVLVNRIESLAAVIIIIFGMRFEYSLFHSRVPKWFFLFLAAGAFLGAFYWVKPFAARSPLFIVTVAAFAEMLRVIGVAILKKKYSAWIIGIGFFAFILAGILQMLYSLKIISWPWFEYGFMYGILFLVVSMSVYLARNFAKTNKDLIAQLRQAQDLKMQQFEAEKLRELDQMKSRFFANISHEFRTPLTLILGPLQRLLSADFSARTKQHFELMIRQGQRLLRLINQLLDLSKLEAGQMVLRARPGDLVKILKQVVASFESAAAKKGVDLTLEAPEAITVFFDRDSLEKILYNLLSNALKFTPEGGRVEVEASTSEVETGRLGERVSGGTISSAPFRPTSLSLPHPVSASPTLPLSAKFVQIAVRDTGPGIPAAQLDRIFDRFYQAGQSQTRTHGGTGIGLALTKELVELHGGEIRVESEPGQGSSFVVRLPDISGDESQVVEEPELETDFPEVQTSGFGLEEAENLEGGQKSAQKPAAEKELPMLLVVEDNHEMRTYIREILDKEFGVLETENGTDGLNRAFETIPDLVISDVMMPEMDGFELCKKLKTDERTCHIPVILLTARASGESRIGGFEIGADDYVTKPFDVRELEVRVKNLIEQRRKLRERFSREITLQPQQVAVTSMDAQFLERAMAAVEEHIADPDFTPEQFARKVAMSRMQLHRKLRALTNQSTGEFIRTMRLQRAAQLLQKKSGTVTEIAYEVGFNNLSYFARSFKELFGQLPSEYEKSQSK